jgi:choline dehydrogenase-like flavoprotein
MSETYDAIVVGTGFASSLFVHRFLEREPTKRVLVLERGANQSHAWQLSHRGELQHAAAASIVNRNPQKTWPFTLAFGGGSNCWWGCTPRMFPDDFECQSRYGIGQDWPLRYDDLETYYTQAEELMHIAGPADSPFPRSKPYPLPAHAFSSPDKVLKAAFPNHFFNQPTARPTRAVGKQPACCNNGVCTLCPIDSKFTIANGLPGLYTNPHVTLVTGADVQQLDVQAGLAQGVTFEHAGKLQTARSELVVLGANGIFNPYLLMRSGLSGPSVGAGLVEQASVFVRVYLDGLDNFDGGTSITGHGYNFYSGDHRKSHAAMMIETWNVPELRLQRGKWRQVLKLKVILEDLRQVRNRVLAVDGDPRPALEFSGPSAYTLKALEALPAKINAFVAPLPVERVEYGAINATEAHIIGTTVMGNDPTTSVVDRHLVHHAVRNLLVLGSGVFPTAAPANPTLTLSALSLWAADKLLS